jgi:DNA mismatch repair protein MutS2
VLEEAQRLVAEDRVRTDALLTQVENQLERTREEWELARRDRERLSEERETSERLSRELTEKMHGLRVEKYLEEDRRLRELQRLLKEVRARLVELESAPPAAPSADLRRWMHGREREAAGLRKTQSRAPRREHRVAGPVLTPDRLQPGERAYSLSLGAEVVVRDVESRGWVWVEHRGKRVRVGPGDLREPDPARPAGARAHVPPLWEAAGPTELAATADTLGGELDLRGLDRESGRRQLEGFLDRALLAGVTRVRIIHGKGTGALRGEVRRLLADHPEVASHRDGEPAEGGWGVTIAFLAGHAAGRGSEGSGA